MGLFYPWAHTGTNGWSACMWMYVNTLCWDYLVLTWTSGQWRTHQACYSPSWINYKLEIWGGFPRVAFTKLDLYSLMTHLMVLSHQSKTTTRQRQDKSWTCAFLLCLSHQVCRTWCERHNRNAQVQHLSCRCLVVVLLWCESTITN